MDAPQDLNHTFVEFVMMQAQQVSLFLGQVSPGPGQEPITNLEIAKKLIDQLSLVRSKMKGNLTADEEKFFNSVLSDLRMGYVQASNQQAASVGSPASSLETEPSAPQAETPTAQAPEPAPPTGETAASEPEGKPTEDKPDDKPTESKKRFTKNYG